MLQTRQRMQLIFLASALASTAAWAPLDGLAGLFGAPPLHDPSASQPEELLHGVEHKPCSKKGFTGCNPAGGCRLHNGVCEPRIGHYWMASNRESTHLGFWDHLFDIPPSTRVMTKRGLMEIEHGFFWSSYKLLVSLTLLS